MASKIDDECGVCGNVELKSHCQDNRPTCPWAKCVTCGSYGVLGTTKWFDQRKKER